MIDYRHARCYAFAARLLSPIRHFRFADFRRFAFAFDIFTLAMASAITPDAALTLTPRRRHAPR